MVWLAIIGLVVAVLSAAFTAGAWLAAKKSLTYQALADVMRDYAKDGIADDVRTLWSFYKDCGEDSDSLIKEFGRVFDSSERRDLTRARRRVSHFYQRVGALHAGGVLPGRVLYRHWSKEDLSVIPKIIVPLENLLYEKLRGRRSTNQFKVLEDLYKDSAKWWRETVV